MMQTMSRAKPRTLGMSTLLVATAALGLAGCYAHARGRAGTQHPQHTERQRVHVEGSETPRQEVRVRGQGDETRNPQRVDVHSRDARSGSSGQDPDGNTHRARRVDPQGPRAPDPNAPDTHGRRVQTDQGNSNRARRVDPQGPRAPDPNAPDTHGRRVQTDPDPDRGNQGGGGEPHPAPHLRRDGNKGDRPSRNVGDAIELKCKLKTPRLPAGSIMTLEGQGWGDSPTVMIGGSIAAVHRHDDKHIRARIPRNSRTGGDVVVKDDGEKTKCGRLSIIGAPRN
jgi:hypothetical protein